MYECFFTLRLYLSQGYIFQHNKNLFLYLMYERLFNELVEGWLKMKLVEIANQEMVNSKSNSDKEAREVAESQSRVGAAIDRLENRLQKI
jgi:hypothetical protein